MKEADVLGMAVWNTTREEQAAQAHVDILKERAQGKMVLTID
jgi:hypothetical protein